MITVQYRCACFAPGQERLLDVTERNPEQDVVAWMKQVQEAVGCDHASVSPLCARPAMEYLKVPFDNDVPVGSVPTRH